MSELEARNLRLARLDANGEPREEIHPTSAPVLRDQAAVGASVMLLAAALHYPDAVVPDDVVDALSRGESLGLRVDMQRVPGGTRFEVHRTIGTTEQGGTAYARPLQVGLRQAASWTPGDLDRCEHGRHSIDSCLSCPGGRSTGNLFGVERSEYRRLAKPGELEIRIGTTVRGEPIWALVHAGEREAGT